MAFVLTTELNTIAIQKAMLTQNIGQQFDLKVLEQMRSRDSRSQYLHFWIVLCRQELAVKSGEIIVC